MVHVPYHGVVPAMTDLLGGQVQVVFSTLPPAIEHVRAGRLRALAVTSAARSEALPDVPTLIAYGNEVIEWTECPLLALSGHARCAAHVRF